MKTIVLAAALVLATTAAQAAPHWVDLGDDLYADTNSIRVSPENIKFKVWAVEEDMKATVTIECGIPYWSLTVEKVKKSYKIDSYPRYKAMREKYCVFNSISLGE